MSSLSLRLSLWRAKTAPPGQREPKRRTGEVVETVGFAGKSDGVREAGFCLANRRLQPLGHLTADAKYTARKHLANRAFLASLQRFFKPPPSSNSTGKSHDSQCQTHRVWAHSRRRHCESGARCWRALCASSEFRTMSQHCRMTAGRGDPSRVAAFTGHSATSLDTTNCYAEISDSRGTSQRPTRRIQGTERSALDTRRPTVVAGRFGTLPFPSRGPWHRIARLRAG